jgi:hypothetical protein
VLQWHGSSSSSGSGSSNGAQQPGMSQGSSPQQCCRVTHVEANR